jgi:hypothetical protein
MYKCYFLIGTRTEQYVMLEDVREVKDGFWLKKQDNNVDWTDIHQREMAQNMEEAYVFIPPHRVTEIYKVEE